MTLRSLSYTFPAGNVTDVCASQTLAGAGAMTLNGNLVNKVNGVMSFAVHGYSRGVSVFSTNDLSGVTFTIIGIQNGVSITENITGPNNSTTYGTLAYDTITSITANGAAAAVSIGSGWQGFFMVAPNLWTDVVNYTLTLRGGAAATAPQFGVFGGLNNIVNNGSTYFTNIAADNIVPIRALAAYTAAYVYSNTGNPTYAALIIQVGQSSATVANSITLNFMQV